MSDPTNPPDDDSEPTPDDETKPMESTTPVLFTSPPTLTINFGPAVTEPGAAERIAKLVAPPEPAQVVSAPTPPVGAWRFVVDDVERLVTITRRGDGCVAASLDEREATAEADDVAVNMLARLLGRAGRSVVVLAPGVVRK